MGRHHILLIFILLIPAWKVATGQPRFSGTPFITEYSYQDYHYHGHTWATVQSPEGDMIFAHNKGVLIYTGHDWEMLELPGRTAAKSLFISHDKVYVGGNNQAGYVGTGKKGEYRYYSLIPDTIDFFAAKDIVVQDSVLYVRSADKLIMHDLVTRQTLAKHHTGTSRFLELSNKWHVMIEGQGLYILTPALFYERDPVPALAGNDLFFRVGAPYNGSVSLVYDEREGFLLLNTQDYSLDKWDNELERLHEFSSPEKALQLSNSEYLFTVPGMGLFLTENDGTLLTILNKDNAFYENTILNAFEDHRGNLWLNTNNGILYSEHQSPFRIIDHRYGLEGYPVFSEFCCHHLFTGTTSGLYSLPEKQKPVAQPRFRPVNKGAAPIAHHVFNRQLLVSFPDSVVLYPSGKKLLPFGVSSFYSSPDDSLQLLAGYNRGIVRITNRRNSWDISPIKGVSGVVTKVISATTRSLWIEKTASALYKLSLNSTSDSVTNTLPIQALASLTSRKNKIFIPGRQPVITNDEGFYVWDEKQEQFSPFSPLSEYLPPKPLDILKKDPEGRYWFWKNGKEAFGGMIGNIFNGVVLDTIIFKRLAQQKVNDIDFYKGNVVFTVNDKLIVYNPEKDKPDKPINVKLSHIYDFVNDTLIQRNPIYQAGNVIVLQPGANNLRFVAHTDLYTATKQMQYAFRLKNHDRKWSAWQNNHFKEYTELKPGKYEIQIKAHDYHGHVSATKPFTIIIKDPWYSTPFALAGYGILLLGMVFFITEKVKQANKKKTLRLENMIKARTQQLTEQKEQIRRERDKINDINMTKDKFFSIIAHDLRSPFNSLLGLSEILHDDFDDLSDKEKKEMVANINKTSNTSFSLVDNLLTWSRSQRDKVEIYPAHHDLAEVVKETLYLLNATAAAKNININNFISTSHIGYFDKNMVLTIVRNLVSNAIKFTHPGGLIELDIEEKPSHLRLSVKDNGIGMSDKELQNLFDIGRQSKRKGTQNEAGTGLGLILCKDFALQNHGNLEVFSEYNKGSTFILQLPKKQGAVT